VRLKAAETEEIKMNMTSMIDIVFQFEYEGDFSVKMPLNGAESDSEIIDLPTVISVSLASDPAGNLTNILVDSSPVDQADLYGGLTREIESRLAGEGNPDSTTETEVDFDIAPALKYSFTVAAIEAVSGKKEGDVVTKLISRIKFKDNSGQ